MAKKFSAHRLSQVHSVVGVKTKTNQSRNPKPHYFSTLPIVLMNALVEGKHKQLSGLYGLPNAREVAIEIITNFPKSDLIEGFEVTDFYASQSTPETIKRLEDRQMNADEFLQERIQNGFHIDLFLKEQAIVDAINNAKFFERPFEPIQTNDFSEQR